MATWWEDEGEEKEEGSFGAKGTANAVNRS